MATLDMQNTAQLAESRRKMQSKRRIKNRIALTLSMGALFIVSVRRGRKIAAEYKTGGNAGVSSKP